VAHRSEILVETGLSHKACLHPFGTYSLGFCLCLLALLVPSTRLSLLIPIKHWPSSNIEFDFHTLPHYPHLTNNLLLEEFYMAKRNYGVLPFFLSLVSMVISTCPFTLLQFARSGRISIECFRQIWGSPVHLSLWGWIPCLVLALVSLYMVSGSQDLLRKIIVWIFSLLAMIEVMLWASTAFDTIIHGPL
jgi:hypothetical protein